MLFLDWTHEFLGVNIFAVFSNWCQHANTIILIWVGFSAIAHDANILKLTLDIIWNTLLIGLAGDSFAKNEYSPDLSSLLDPFSSNSVLLWAFGLAFKQYFLFVSYVWTSMFMFVGLCMRRLGNLRGQLFGNGLFSICKAVNFLLVFEELNWNIGLWRLSVEPVRVKPEETDFDLSIFVIK